MTKPIAIAVSGGVDSLVTAYLLKQQGFDVFGIHFLTGYEKNTETGPTEMKSLFRPLGMVVHIADLQEQFKTQVVDYFSTTYQDGETPNPCMVCNLKIKFGALLQTAIKLGASKLATGHYARITKEIGGRLRLLKGVDKRKDQSYFLSRLNQEQLERACFPLGTLTKERVKALAKEKGLRPISQEESQDVCFIRDSTYAAFLTGSTRICSQSGDIVDTADNLVGTHNGLHRFTVGQRRGINCPASEAYYVVRIEPATNRLVVGFKGELNTSVCHVRDINWIAEVPEGPITVDSRIRYRHVAVASTLIPNGKDRAVVRFDRPQAAITPGQGAVFYQGDEVVGGGWITSEVKPG